MANPTFDAHTEEWYEFEFSSAGVDDWCKHPAPTHDTLSSALKYCDEYMKESTMYDYRVVKVVHTKTPVYVKLATAKLKPAKPKLS